MARSQSPSALGFIVGTMLATCALVASVGTGTGCSTQETTQAPDAALPPCNPGPFVFCQPVGPEVPSCNTDDGTSRWLTRLQRDTRYPVGCVIDYVGERDEQGDCKLEAVCKCVVGEIPTAPAGDGGSSTEADAGDDGGDAGEAGAPAPPPPDAGPPATGPVWNCYP